MEVEETFLALMWYSGNIYTRFSVDELITVLLEKGGRIDKYYLRTWNKNKHTICYLNGWFAGKNIREALLKALN